MKAVTTSLIFVFATSSTLFAQTAAPVASQPGSESMAPAAISSVDAGVQEATRRQAAQIEARKKLDQAKEAEQRGDLEGAAKLYDAAWDLAESVGPSADLERRLAVIGIVSARMRLANVAQHHGDYYNADVQVQDILRVDPGNQMAVEFKMANDKLIEASRATQPSKEAIESMKGIHEDQVQTAQLVQDGKLMFQLGRMDEAEAKLTEAVTRDPNNQAALYYLSLVKNNREKQMSDARNVQNMNSLIDVERDWRDNDARDSLPKPNIYARSNTVYTSPQRQKVYEKLNDIFFDKISFPNLPLSEVVSSLSEQTERRDPDKEGINFLISKVKPAAAAAVAAPGAVP